MTTEEQKKAALLDLDYIEECCPHKKGTVLGNRFDRVRAALASEPMGWQSVPPNKWGKCSECGCLTGLQHLPSCTVVPTVEIPPTPKG